MRTCRPKLGRLEGRTVGLRVTDDKAETPADSRNLAFGSLTSHKLLILAVPVAEGGPCPFEHVHYV